MTNHDPVPVKMIHLILAVVATLFASTSMIWGMAQDTVSQNELVLLREIMQSEHENIRREIRLLTQD